MKCLECGKKMTAYNTKFPKRYRRCTCGAKLITIEVPFVEYQYLKSIK